MSPRRLVAFAAVYVVVGGAQAQVGTPGVGVAVGVQAQVDSNVFRLPDAVTPQQAGIGGGRGDHVVQPYVEADATAQLGRQQWHAYAHGRRLTLTQHGAYDADTLDAGLDWNWALTNAFGGVLSTGQRQESTSFADFLGAQRNVLTVRQDLARIDWHPQPDRRLSAGVSQYRGTDSAPARITSDYVVRNATLEIALDGTPGDEIGLSATHTDGRYPNRQITLLFPIDNGYRQDSVETHTKLVDGPWQLDVRAGAAHRRYRTLADRDFSGPTGSARATWRPTGKLVVDASWTRDLNAVDEYDNLFVVQTARHVAITWQATSKIALTADWTGRTNAYRGEPLNLLVEVLGPRPPRNDHLTDTALGVGWSPIDRVTVQFQRIWSSRSSSREGYQYFAKIWSAGVRYEWR